MTAPAQTIDAVAAAQYRPPRRSWARARQLALLCVASVGTFLAARALSPFQEVMRSDLSLTDGQMAILQGPALAFPIVVAALPLGFVIDRYSRARLIRIAVALSLAGALLTALGSSFPLLVIGRSTVGLSLAAVAITSFSLVADLYAPEERGRAKALIVIGQYAGVSLSFAGGGFLLSHLGADHWREAFLGLTVAPPLLVLLLLLGLREAPRVDVELRDPSLKESLREAWRYRGIIVPIGLGIILAEIPAAAIQAWAAPMFERDFVLGRGSIGLILGLATIAGGLVGPLCGGVIADLCQRTGGPRRTIVALAILSLLGAPLSGFGLVHSPVLSGIGIALVFVVTAATVGMGITLFTIVVPNELRGMCLSLLSAFDSLFAAALAPIVVSGISSAAGGGSHLGVALAITCGGACLVCSITYAATAWFRRAERVR